MWRIEGMIWTRRIRMKTSSCNLFLETCTIPIDNRLRLSLSMELHCMPNAERSESAGIRREGDAVLHGMASLSTPTPSRGAACYTLSGATRRSPGTL